MHFVEGGSDEIMLRNSSRSFAVHGLHLPVEGVLQDQLLVVAVRTLVGFERIALN